MKSLRYSSLIPAFCLSTSALAQFPTWDAEQTAVWEFVERSWVDEVAENDRWPRDYVHQKVVSWTARLPAPRGINKIVEWYRYDYAASNTLFYDITPAAIVVEDNTAVVHYHLQLVTEDPKEERETVTQSLVEVLVRQGGEWKFLSLSAFEPNLNSD